MSNDALAIEIPKDEITRDVNDQVIKYKHYTLVNGTNIAWSSWEKKGNGFLYSCFDEHHELSAKDEFKTREEVPPFVLTIFDGPPVVEQFSDPIHGVKKNIRIL